MKRALVVALLLAAPGFTQEFRVLRAIPTPAPNAGLPVPFRTISHDAIVRALEDLFAAWNTPRLREYLSDSFLASTRLPDELAVKVPRDAVLKLLAVDSITTLKQTVEPAPDAVTPAVRVVSLVAVVVRSQIEFNDPDNGFQRREGRSELILEIAQVVPK